MLTCRLKGQEMNVFIKGLPMTFCLHAAMFGMQIDVRKVEEITQVLNSIVQGEGIRKKRFSIHLPVALTGEVPVVNNPWLTVVFESGTMRNWVLERKAAFSRKLSQVSG